MIEPEFIVQHCSIAMDRIVAIDMPIDIFYDILVPRYSWTKEPEGARMIDQPHLRHLKSYRELHGPSPAGFGPDGEVRVRYSDWDAHERIEAGEKIVGPQ
ncbi:hypothetical protein WJT74_05045 [Sphingomicrobium sp. XHP0239]|uniref:hypothetical protein n=1 Tax=Sphingomicrobium maritimum TaxID=3133972 RepID=UPI0031CC7D5D